MGFLDSFKGTLALWQPSPAEVETAQATRQRLRVVRAFALVELALSNLAAVLAPVAVVLYGMGLLEKLMTVWYFLIAPAVLSGAALHIFHARASRRAWSPALGELATWSVFPVGTTIFLMYLTFQRGAAAA